MFHLLKEKLAALIADAASVPLEEAEKSIELPKGQFGDVASSICFSLAKKLKKSPVELARELAGKIRPPYWVEYAKADGPYINFILSNRFFDELLTAVETDGEKFGRGTRKKGKTLLEFPSVNPNKPWHIGHLRNALLGDSVARLLEFSGETVERMDYIDDLGLQVAQSFWGYLHLGKKPAGKFDLWMGGEYVEVAKRFETDEKVQKEVRALLKKMEEGEGREAAECRKLVEECVAAQYETAFQFGIYHDVLIFESDILHSVYHEGMKLLKSSKAIEVETEGKNAGCLVARMESEEFAAMESPDKILVRSDGTATYTGKDVVFHFWKYGLLKHDFAYSDFIRQPNGKICKMSHRKGKKGKFGGATRVINVIGMEQAYPQKVIKEIFRSMGYKKEADSKVHLAYEHVGLEDEKFSGRQGTWMGYTADELYSEGLLRAEKKIKPEVDGEQRGQIATKVASAAIRFSFLKTSPEKKITFRWDDALSLEGDSAPYAMYAHARAHKIFAKGGGGKIAPGAELALAEREALKKVMVFGEVAASAALHMRPHIMAEYCLELATAYNKFYNSCQILNEQDEKVKQHRLAINLACKTVLMSALGLMGIPAPEKM